ncbi:MAG: hypothetical protein U9N59_06145 [Campylobacterota bacterium]|nr:hypothetical protein [Campylobacterota bacterium]
MKKLFSVLIMSIILFSACSKYQTVPSYNGGYKYKEGIRQAMVFECQRKGASRDFCICVANNMQDMWSESKFLSVGTAISNKTASDVDILKITKSTMKCSGKL